MNRCFKDGEDQSVQKHEKEDPPHKVVAASGLPPVVFNKASDVYQERNHYEVDDEGNHWLKINFHEALDSRIALEIFLSPLLQRLKHFDKDLWL